MNKPITTHMCEILNIANMVTVRNFELISDKFNAISIWDLGNYT